MESEHRTASEADLLTAIEAIGIVAEHLTATVREAQAFSIELASQAARIAAIADRTEALEERAGELSGDVALLDTRVRRLEHDRHLYAL